MNSQRQTRPALSLVIEILAAILAAGGVFVFVVFRLYYNQFYGRLSINPADVGLGYANVLANSSGIILYNVLAISVLIGLLYLTAVRVARIQVLLERRNFVRWCIGIAVGFILLSATGLFSNAIRFSNAVREGRAVRAGLVPFASSTVRAVPARITLVGAPGDMSALETLHSRSRTDPLLYMGQANSMIVLYDSATQEVLYIPAASAMLQLSNCEVQPSKEPACQRALGA